MKSYRQFIAAINEAKFAGADISKRDGEYVELVVKRIKEGQPFVFADGNREVILYDENVMALEADIGSAPSMLKTGSKFAQFFTTASGKSYRWTDIDKSLFSGKIDRLKKEKIATAQLNDAIQKAMEEFGGPITVKLGKYKMENVVSAGSEHIKGDPKADIALMDEAGKEVGFLSHKADSGAKAFQQYGGITLKSGKEIHNHPLVYKFAKALQDALIVKNGEASAKAGDSFYWPVPKTREGEKLIGMSVYGPKWDGGKTFGRDSVHAIGQGDPILTRVGEGVYEMTFSYATHPADDVSWGFKGEFQSVFAARYMGGRGLKIRDVNVKNIRPGIFPVEYIKNRKATEL